MNPFVANKTARSEGASPFIGVVERAMQRVMDESEAATAEHFTAFTQMIRDKYGLHSITLDEPYLPGTVARASLTYLKKLDQLADVLTQMAEGQELTTTLFDVDEPLLPQISQRLEIERLRHRIVLKQRLDAVRQPAAGIASVGPAGDERVRPSHGAAEGQIFAWDGPGSHPGEEANCRCYCRTGGGCGG